MGFYHPDIICEVKDHLWGPGKTQNVYERSSLPSKKFPCISMDMLQMGALVLLGRLVEAMC